MLNSAGINYWEPPKGQPTPNDIVVPGTFECYGWWETYPGLVSPSGGSPVLLDVATIDTFGTWTVLRLQNWASGQADPDGGTDAWLVQEIVDGAPTTHRVTSSAAANLAGPWSDFLVWGKPIDRDWCAVYNNTSGDGIYINFSTGATSPMLGVAYADDLGVESGGRWFNVRFRGPVIAGGNVIIYTADNTPNYIYQGTGLVCAHIYTRAVPIALTQPHVDTLYDMSRSVGVPRAHNLNQTTVADRLIQYTTFSTVNGVAVPYSHVGRNGFCRGLAANLTGVVAGTDQAFATIGVGSMTGAFGQLNRWYHDVNNFVNPFYISGADLRSARNGAVGNDTQMIQVGGAAQFATARSYAYIFNSDRTGALYVDGAQVGTFTHGAAGAITMAPGTYYNNQPAGPTTTAQTPASAVFKGQVPGTTFGEQYGWLLRALGPMANRWGRPA